MAELTAKTIAELRDGFRSGEFTAREIAEGYNAAVAAAKSLNAYTVETPDDALAAAEAADDARGSGDLPSLAGIPLGIKDLFATRGVDTTAGSNILKGFRPPYESTVTANLRKAGAGMLGKLNMDEFAMGSSNETSAYGPVISPWRRKGSNVGLTPGGSSGGSAAAVSALLAPGATGTDTGGSIRQPAAFVGICGIKPTYGRCSRWGIVSFASSLDQAGPMARTVRDCALQLEVMAGGPSRDARVPAVPVERWSEGLSGDLRGMRVGVAERYFFEHTAADIAARVRRAVDGLAHAGAEIVEIDLEWPTPMGEGDPFIPEGAATLQEFWPARRDEIGPDVARDLALSDGMAAVPFAAVNQYRLEYAGRMLEKVRAAGIDVIASPAQAQTPPPTDALTIPYAGHPEMDVTYAMCGLTLVFNMLGWPAVSVPCGRDDAGLPVGIQLAALPWREDHCFAAAAAVEAAAL